MNTAALLSPTARVPVLPLLSFACALNALLPAAARSVSESGWSAAFGGGFGHSFVLWLSLLVALRLTLGDRQTTHTPHPRIYLVCALISLVLLIPSAMLGWLLCALSAALWHQHCATRSIQRVAAGLLVVIALREPMIHLLLQLFSGEILAVDAWLAVQVLGLISDDFTLSGNIIAQSNGHSLLILTGCSAFGNLSLALLLWLALQLDRQRQVTGGDTLRMAGVIFTVIAINTLRLSLMGINQQWYDLLHGDDGALICDSLTLLAPLIFVRWRTRHASYSAD